MSTSIICEKLELKPELETPFDMETEKEGIAADSLAKLIMYEATQKNKQINTFALNKLLYLLNGRYLAKTGKFLVQENFYVIPDCPIVREVFAKYYLFRYRNLPRVNNLHNVYIPADKIAFLHKELKELLEMPPWKITELTTKHGTAWAKVFWEENVLYGPIKNSYIQEEWLQHINQSQEIPMNKCN